MKDKGRRDYTLNPTTRGPTNGVQFMLGALEIAETLPQHLSRNGEPIVVTFSGTETRRGHHLSTQLTPKAIGLPKHG